ncbi:MAG: PHP-associated domain-containing protein [Candidatus Lernaella stagnicola]|nr:PHP-associated domain-containing protein [Candidatus Lernaella stagnicola]
MRSDDKPSPTKVRATPRVAAMDPHIHTDYSDGQTTVAEAVDVARSRNLGLAICDHNEIRGAIALWQVEDLVSIPAIEIGSAERIEFLLYFRRPEQLEEYFIRHVEPYKKSRFYAKLNRSFELLIPAAKESGAVVCLPHPFAPGWKNFNYNRGRKQKMMTPEFMEHIDLIEVINSHMSDGRNFKAFMLSEILDKAVSAGSDAHRKSEIGAAYLSFGRELDVDEIFDLLRGRIKVGSESRYRFTRTLGTSRGVIVDHLNLYFRKSHQTQWMIPYEEEKEWDSTKPDRRRGSDRRRLRTNSK